MCPTITQALARRTCLSVQYLQCLPDYYEEYCSRAPECSNLCTAFVELSCGELVPLAQLGADQFVDELPVPTDLLVAGDPSHDDCVQDNPDPDKPRPGCESWKTFNGVQNVPPPGAAEPYFVAGVKPTDVGCVYNSLCIRNLLFHHLSSFTAVVTLHVRHSQAKCSTVTSKSRLTIE